MNQNSDEGGDLISSWVVLEPGEKQRDIEEQTAETSGVEEVNEETKGEESPNRTPTPIESDTESISVISESGSCKGEDEEEGKEHRRLEEIERNEAEIGGGAGEIELLQQRELIAVDASRNNLENVFGRRSAYAFVIIGLSVFAHYYFNDSLGRFEDEEIGHLDESFKYSNKRLLPLNQNQRLDKEVAYLQEPQTNYKKIKSEKKHKQKIDKKQKDRKIYDRNRDKNTNDVSGDNEAYSEFVESLKIKEKYLRKKEKHLLKKEHDLKKEEIQLNKKKQFYKQNAQSRHKENTLSTIINKENYGERYKNKPKYDKDYHDKHYFKKDDVNNQKYIGDDKYTKKNQMNIYDKKRNLSKTN